VVTRDLVTAKPPASLFTALDTFPDRHIGPDDMEAAYMLSKLGFDSMDAFVQEAVPPAVRISSVSITDKVIKPLSEEELNRRAKELGQANKPFKSYIGMGYHNAVVPPVILRNVSSDDVHSLIATEGTCSRSWKTRRGTRSIPLTNLRLLKVGPRIMEYYSPPYQVSRSS